MTTLKDKKHPHYDVIVTWAADPSIRIQFKSKQSNTWSDLGNEEEPRFFHSLDYRIKPKPIDITYRRALMVTDPDKSYYIINVKPRFQEDIQASNRFVKWLGNEVTETLDI